MRKWYDDEDDIYDPPADIGDNGYGDTAD